MAIGGGDKGAAAMKIFNTIGKEERSAAAMAASAWPLSGYLGSRPDGGHQIKALEQEWSEHFNVRYSVAVNSATSGLLAACMAVGVERDDEVIVSPYTMSATAAAPKLVGAKIRWADIESDTFCIDPVEVSNLITNRTKAVIVTNLFGHPARLAELRQVCDAHGIYLIEDNAQSIGATEHGNLAGTVGHIGVFSLNVHKHIQVGEGGICCTNSTLLNTKLREAMNHGEMRNGILGLNLRMTEVTAAMAREQLKKLPFILDSRIALAQDITDRIERCGLAIKPPAIRAGCTHSFYVWAGQMYGDVNIKPPFRHGYLHPLYSLPAFRTRETIICPVTEEVERKMVLFEVCAYDPTLKELTQAVEAMK